MIANIALAIQGFTLLLFVNNDHASDIIELSDFRSDTLRFSICTVNSIIKTKPAIFVAISEYMTWRVFLDSKTAKYVFLYAERWKIEFECLGKLLREYLWIPELAKDDFLLYLRRKMRNWLSRLLTMLGQLLRILIWPRSTYGFQTCFCSTHIIWNIEV